MTGSSQRRLTCAHCGKAFSCGAGSADGRCWCADEAYRMPMPASADEDCLCPDCLRAKASQFGADARS